MTKKEKHEQTETYKGDGGITNLIERLRLGDGTSPDHLLLLEAADALEKSVAWYVDFGNEHEPTRWKQCPSCGGDCGYTKNKGCQYGKKTT